MLRGWGLSKWGIPNPIDQFLISMGDLQDPKMEVLYHIFGHILGGVSPEI